MTFNLLFYQKELLPTVDEHDSKIEKFRSNLSSFSNWNDEWNSNVKTLIDSI
jgi:hypothetical protein